MLFFVHTPVYPQFSHILSQGFLTFRSCLKLRVFGSLSCLPN